MGRMTPACVEDQASLRTTTANSLASLPPALSGLVTHLALLQSRAQAPAGQVQGSSSLASRAEDPAITNADIFDLVQEAVEISFVNKDSVIGSMSSRVAALESHLVAARQELQDAFAKIADLQNGVANSASVSSLDALAARLPPSQEMLPRDALERVFDKLDEDGAVIQQLTETVEAQAEQLRNEVHLANAFRRTTADELVTLKERTAMTEGLASRMPNDKLAGTGDAASNIESLIATAPSIIDINEKLAATEDDHAQLRDGVDRMSLRAQTFEDVARSLAQQFDLLASEQDNCARQVNESREATHAGLSDLSGAVEALQGMAFRRGLQSSLASPPSQLDRSSQLPSQNFSDQELDNSSEHQPPLQRQQRDSQFPAAPVGRVVPSEQPLLPPQSPRGGGVPASPPPPPSRIPSPRTANRLTRTSSGSLAGRAGVSSSSSQARSSGQLRPEGRGHQFPGSSKPEPASGGQQATSPRSSPAQSPRLRSRATGGPRS